MIHTQLSKHGVTYMGDNQCISHACQQQMLGNDAHPQVSQQCHAVQYFFSYFTEKLVVSFRRTGFLTQFPSHEKKKKNHCGKFYGISIVEFSISRSFSVTKGLLHIVFACIQENVTAKTQQFSHCHGLGLSINTCHLLTKKYKKGLVRLLSLLMNTKDDY